MRILALLGIVYEVNNDTSHARVFLFNVILMPVFSFYGCGTVSKLDPAIDGLPTLAKLSVAGAFDGSSNYWSVRDTLDIALG